MTIIFYVAAGVAVLATVLAITRAHPMHALLYFVVSLVAVALIFLLLGAPLVSALELIVYAGAVMVLFVFVVMVFNLGGPAVAAERRLLAPRVWLGPAVLALILALELGYVLFGGRWGAGAPAGASPKVVGMALLGPYVLGVEIASMLLLAGLVGAYHLGRRGTGGRGGPRP